MAQSDDQSDDRSDDQSNDQTGNEDLKAKMRAALDRKKRSSGTSGNSVAHPAGAKQKARGSEVLDAGTRMHRRKAGGGGA